jgi:hypothetical protein
LRKVVILPRHNRPQRRAVPGPPRRTAGTADADAADDGVSLGNPRVTGKNQGRNLVFTIDLKV